MKDAHTLIDAGNKQDFCAQGLRFRNDQLAPARQAFVLRFDDE